MRYGWLCERDVYKFYSWYAAREKLLWIIIMILWWNWMSGNLKQRTGQREGDDGHPVSADVLRLDQQVHAAVAHSPWGAQRWYRVRLKLRKARYRVFFLLLLCGFFQMLKSYTFCRFERIVNTIKKKSTAGFFFIVAGTWLKTNWTRRTTRRESGSPFFPSSGDGSEYFYFSVLFSASSPLPSTSLWRTPTWRYGSLLRKWWKRWPLGIWPIWPSK